MSRLDLFNKAYPAGEDTTSMFTEEYEQLKTLWEIAPEEERDQLLELPEPLRAKGELDPDIVKLYTTDEEGHPVDDPQSLAWLELAQKQARLRAEHVRIVDQRYRHRMASNFAADLPDIFRRVMMMADEQYALDLLFFGTMGALSCTLPGVKGSYNREEFQSNLFLFVTGNAAAGKGRIGLCRKLVETIHENHQFFWQYIIPANSSDTAIYAQLAANLGRGIIFETEADTLSNALGKACGKFGEGLRKAFHNEAISYMRRTNNEQILISQPYLSVLLTGTPRQLQRLIKDPEDGLYSRFLFYRLESGQESFPAPDPLHRGITGEMVNDYMRYLGEMVSDFFERLLEKIKVSANGTAIRFSLTEEQGKRYQQHFNCATKEYEQLFREMYRSEERAAEAEPVMRRLGNICLRMMMILTVSRLITEERPEIPDEVVCDQRDFDLVMQMEPELRHHNHIHYDAMLVANGTLLPMEDENSETGDMLTDLQRAFYAALPAAFTRKEALQVAERLAETDAAVAETDTAVAETDKGVAKVAKVAESRIPERTVDRCLKRYCQLGILTHLKQGKYEKPAPADASK